MNCKKRNKKLFTHIALAALMIFVLIILIDTFSGKLKIREGLSSGKLGEYHRKAIGLKIDIKNDPEKAEKFKSYVNLYLQSLASKKSENNDEENKEKEEKASEEDREAIEKILSEKLGDGGNTFDTLKSGIMSDPESQYSEWLSNNTPKTSEQMEVGLKNVMEKIEELYKEMQKE